MENANSSSAKSAKNGVDEPDVKNRGWPKGKKRYPKSPNAPKQPLSGYVHFLNDRREELKKECPDISFAEISKKLASEWSSLDPALKQKYNEKAEADKERYNKEFSTYQHTDEYKQFVESQKGLSANKKKKPNKTPGGSKVGSEQETEVKVEVTTSGTDVPIFTEEFLELNKARETELKQLKKQTTEYEEQNAILQKHVDNMKSAITKLDHETREQQENNAALEKHLVALRELCVKHFKGVEVPGFSGTLNGDNVDVFMTQLKSLVQDKATENAAVLTKVKEIASQIDYSSLVAHH